MADVIPSIAAADKWLDIARPIIREYLELDQMETRLSRARHEMEGDYLARVSLDEAAGHVRTAANMLIDMLPDIRSQMIGDNCVDTSKLTDDDIEAWDASEDHNDELERETISVGRAISQVEREDCDAFISGRIAA